MNEMDAQGIISDIHIRLERSIGKVCRMEDGSTQTTEKVFDIVNDINSAMLMLHGLRFAIRRGYHRVSVWPEPDERELKNKRNGWTD